MPAHQEAPAVSPVVSATGDEGQDPTTRKEEGSAMNVQTASFVRDIAEFTGADNPDDSIQIGAQLHVDEDSTEYRFVLVNSIAVLVDEVGALIDALLEAKAMAASNLKAVA